MSKGKVNIIPDPIVQNIFSQKSEMLLSSGINTKNPTKYTHLEVIENVNMMGLITDEQQTLVNDLVLQVLRDAKRIKAEGSSTYRFPHILLSYGVLDSKTNSGLVAQLYEKKTYTVSLTDEEHKLFIENVEPPSKENGQRWKFVKDFTDPETKEIIKDKEHGYTPNYS
jgi:hypothetical protein